MGDVIPIHHHTPDDDADILTDIYLQLNMAAGDLGYSEDRVSWLKRLESVLTSSVHADYVEFTEGMWE